MCLRLVESSSEPASDGPQLVIASLIRRHLRQLELEGGVEERRLISD